ncbi:MAG: GGDEF domain-containing protein, partial [Eubacteriales bacterium]
GIRHGMAKYHWIVLVMSLLYAWVTIAGAKYLGVWINPLSILNQLLFFTAFGVMSSYIFKKDYQRRIEKEDLISELQSAYQQLCVYNAQVEELANTDPLTGIYNYRYFTERLDKELELSKRFNRFLCLIIIDIDHFKDFNDTYGHPTGDLALKGAATVFRQNIRDKDVLCRYGGEEFLILLPSTGIEEAFKCAERIRESIQHHPVVINGEQTVHITISGGVASYPLDAGTGEQLLRIADEVLYSAKHKGRNKIHRRL